MKGKSIRKQLNEQSLTLLLIEIFQDIILFRAATFSSIKGLTYLAVRENDFLIH